MPIYEYECRRCRRRLETMRRLSDPPLTECPECGGELRKLVSAPAFQFKGSGWYVTDYAKKGGEAKGEAGQGGEAKAGGGDKAGEGESAAAGSGAAGKDAGSSSAGASAAAAGGAKAPAGGGSSESR